MGRDLRNDKSKDVTGDEQGSQDSFTKQSQTQGFTAVCLLVELSTAIAKTKGLS